jgi:release factor glutamine methyltransferase
MTVARALHDGQARLRAAGIADAELEAELLLRRALALSREELFIRLQEPFAPEEARAYEALLGRRLAHEPSAYIIGHKEFYGLELACTPAALIPRPETELLVERALEWLRAREQRTRNKEPGRAASPLLVDVGTGNGAIAIAIAVHAPRVRIVGIDPSRAALALARRNAGAHGVAGRIAFVRGSLLAPFPRKGKVDLIVANLPYVPTRLYRKLPPELREHEPQVALHAGRRGTALIERLLGQAPALLRPDGLLLAEHAWNQGRRLRAAAQSAFPRARIETKRDLAGRERVLVVRIRRGAQ